MRAFIKSSGIISPQLTYTGQFQEHITEIVSDRLLCIEPEYKELISPILLRRMPRILKMGLASSKLCINRSGGINPDGIIVGTGLGCIDNLEKFLMDVIDNKEHITSVLPFINSTHNAVAAQIAMLIKNQNYNTTYCHRGFSFESALTDALMMVHEKKKCNVLVGGIDECTDDFILLHSYLNDWKKEVSNLGLLHDKTPGTIAGEGSCFFMMSHEPWQSDTGVCVEGVRTFFTPEINDVSEIENEINDFLKNIDIDKTDLDAVLMGFNGDVHHDRFYYILMDNYFNRQTILYYKHLCGEYYTSSAFALWLASVVINNSEAPEIIHLKKRKSNSLKNILIYNQIKNTEHSLIFLKYGRL
jgi:hypothetical protein